MVPAEVLADQHTAEQHEGMTVPGCPLCATLQPFVTVQVSRELLAALDGRWSEPVQVMIEALPDGHEASHTMVLRRA